MDMKQTVDRVLGRAVENGDVPGVVAMAATEDRILYEGAFGTRDLAGGGDMTLDTVFWYASMTKALVATGAMQLVERGRIKLDEPVADLLPKLAAPQVLEGFDDRGVAILRPAARPITARHLLTHTSGFAYDIWNDTIGRYMNEADLPTLLDCRIRSLDVPLMFDPGDRWEYGISMDWAGQLIEAVTGQSLAIYLRDNLFQPLGMRDTGFLITSSQRERLAKVHQRNTEGRLESVHYEVSQEPEFFMGGGGCYGTAGDYLTFVRMFLNGGRSSSGDQVLKPETIDLMAENSIGELNAGILRPVVRHLAVDTDFFPGIEQKWGLSFLINQEESANGRSAGSMCWGGLANTYFWIDRAKRTGGVIMTQILPFSDPAVLTLYGELERATYGRTGADEAAA